MLAPVAALAGGWLWPALRLVNALLGAAAVALVYRAARTARAAPGPALAAAALFAACDAFLFAAGTARNDALPCALLAGALPAIVRAGDGRGTRGGALLAGLLLSMAAAAKLSYALPALGYGLYALVERRHRPGWIALGALPAALLIGWCATLPGFGYGVLDFPVRGPAQYYRAIGQGWKLGWGAKAVDFAKFLALGPALPALLIATRFRWRPGGRAPDWMLLAAVLAALAPTPTWRQYLLPLLPPLFLRLAVGWTLRPPTARGRVAMLVFAGAGLAPTVAGLLGARPALPAAIRATQAVAAALDGAGIGDGTATLAPQLLGARLADPRFATGPFHFRSRGLLAPAEEARLHLVSRDTLARLGTPPAVLTGAEGWVGADRAPDAALDRWARAQRYAPRRIGPLRLWLRPR